MNSKSNQNPPFRDTIRERNAVKRTKDTLGVFKVARANFTDLDWAAWTGRLSADLENLLAVVENLQAVADHAEGGTR